MLDSVKNYRRIKKIIIILTIINVYLGYFGIKGYILDKNTATEYEKYQKIYKKNQKIILQNTNTIAVIKGAVEDQDKIDEFIKQNYEYVKPREKVVAIQIK